MSTTENKQRITHAFERLSAGDSRPYIDLLADDIVWTVIGNTRWSGTFRTRTGVVERLLRPVNRLLAPGYEMRVVSLVAEGDRLVVEIRGKATAKAGVPYNNTYCWVCRMADGQIKELTEYADTELFTAALVPEAG